MEASDMQDILTESKPNCESNRNFSIPKGLMTIVIVMGIMIIVGTVALLWIIIHRMIHPHAEAVATNHINTEISQSMTSPALLTIPRHADEQIRSVSPRHDGSVAVTLLSSKGGGRILLWLPEQARVVAEFDLGADIP